MSKKIMLFIAHIFIGVISPIILGIIFPLPAWEFVISISKIFEMFGVTLDLVGEPSTVDSGAVIVAVLYLCIIVAISYGLIKKKYTVLGITLLTSGLVMSNFVFILVSSIIWF